jgi:P27 family predicted phage terminase small subunit
MADRYRPKPVEQKIREGNPSRRPLPEVMLVGGRPAIEELIEPPEHLPEDAKEFWTLYIRRLVEVGVIDRVDVPALEMLATVYARVRQSGRVVDHEGHFTLGARGQIREHPSLRIEREYIGLYRQLAGEFALTPVARTRLGLAELHRRTLNAEMTDALGTPDLTPVD